MSPRQQGGQHALPVKGGSVTIFASDFWVSTAWLFLFVGFILNLLTQNSNNRNLLLATMIFLWISTGLYFQATRVSQNWIAFSCILVSAILVTLAQACENFTLSNIAIFIEIAAVLLNSMH